VLRPSLYWLLVFVPVSAALELTGASPIAVFLTSSLAIIPLAALIGRATESLAIQAGPRVGGLLNATFGNITELIIVVLLIRASQFDVVKASLIGSILGNILLVLGASFFAGGLRFKEMRFSTRSAGVQTSSLLLAVLALVMPALFVNLNPSTGAQRLVMSEVVAVVLMVLYAGALYFTFVTHSQLFRRPEEDEAAEWSLPRATLVLLAAAVLVGIESGFLTGSLEATEQQLNLSPIFIGMFVVAIVGNAAEHASAVFFALRNKMNVAVEIAFGSSTQIALFVAPLAVFISLLLRNPMDFIFTAFEVAAVGLATLIVGVAVLDGRTNWLEGLQLLGAYVILGMSFFFVGIPQGAH
jgi:Ca2+:H+ antiporter